MNHKKIDAVYKPFVDSIFIDPSKIRNNGNADFKDKNLNKVCFVKVNSMPAIGELLIAKSYVDQVLSNSVDEPTLVWRNHDNHFNKFNSKIMRNISLNTQAFNDNQVNTKSFVDQFHPESEDPEEC